MSDAADRADSEIERLNREAMRQRQPAGPPATGCCLWCDVPLAPGCRFCGRDCRDGWQEHRRRLAANGRKEE